MENQNDLKEAPHCAAQTGQVEITEPVGSTGGWRLLLGRLMLRACPSSRKMEVCEDCHLRVFCVCAHRNYLAGAAVEKRFWMTLALCGGAAVLYVVFSFFRAG